MSENTKKLILILLFLIVSIGLAFLIYFVFFAKKQVPSENQEQTQQSQNVEFPEAGGGGAQVVETGTSTIQGQGNQQQNNVQVNVQDNSTQITDRDISKINSYSKVNGGVVYYDNTNQSFYKIAQNGTISKLSDRKFYSVTGATFSPTKNEAILEYPDKRKVLYDFDKDEFVARFPEQTQDFAFSESGDKLSYKWIDYYEDQNYLVTSNVDASNFKFIRPIADQANNIKDVWSPDGEVIATFRKQSDLERQEIYFINENDKNLGSLLVDGFNFDGIWNTKGDKLLYSVTEPRNDFKPVLWVANGAGDNLGYGKASLGINTWVDKCSFSNTNSNIVYCAVPDSVPSGAGLNSSLVSGYPYSIYKINIDSGSEEIVAQPVVNNSKVSIDKIYVGQNDSQIFYINSSNGQLYSINLN